MLKATWRLWTKARDDSLNDPSSVMRGLFRASVSKPGNIVPILSDDFKNKPTDWSLAFNEVGPKSIVYVQLLHRGQDMECTRIEHACHRVDWHVYIGNNTKVWLRLWNIADEDDPVYCKGLVSWSVDKGPAKYENLVVPASVPLRDLFLEEAKKPPLLVRI